MTVLQIRLLHCCLYIILAQQLIATPVAGAGAGASAGDGAGARSGAGARVGAGADKLGRRKIVNSFAFFKPRDSEEVRSRGRGRARVVRPEGQTLRVARPAGQATRQAGQTSRQRIKQSGKQSAGQSLGRPDSKSTSQLDTMPANQPATKPAKSTSARQPTANPTIAATTKPSTILATKPEQHQIANQPGDNLPMQPTSSNPNPIKAIDPSIQTAEHPRAQVKQVIQPDVLKPSKPSPLLVTKDRVTPEQEEIEKSGKCSPSLACPLAATVEKLKARLRLHITYAQEKQIDLQLVGQSLEEERARAARDREQIDRLELLVGNLTTSRAAREKQVLVLEENFRKRFAEEDKVSQQKMSQLNGRLENAAAEVTALREMLLEKSNQVESQIVRVEELEENLLKVKAEKKGLLKIVQQLASIGKIKTN